MLLIMYCVTLIKIAFSRKKLCKEYRTACRTAQGIVRKSDEFIIEQNVFAKSAYRNAHAVAFHSIKLCLRAIIFFEITKELFGRGGEV